MKMSKSINDYKEAMDNIKISESFYKRTEVLLTELPEVKIEKRPVISGRRISAVIMSAAACLICVFGIKLAVDGRQADIITETATDGDTGTLTETGGGADELIDEFGEYEDGGIVAESIESSVTKDAEDEETAAGSPAPASSPKTETEVPAYKPAANDPDVSKTTSASSASSTETTVTTEKRVVQGIDPYANLGAGAEAPENEPTDAEPEVYPDPNPGVSGGEDDDTVEYDEEDIDEVPDFETESDSGAAAVTTGSAALFSELSLDNTTVDVTPYFNMGGIKSGEGTVQKNGAEFKPVLDLISGMDSSATKIGNGSFTSLFSIMIYDENIDLEFYSIYLTNHESIVITKHSPDGGQVRETYALRREYYEDVRHQLFLLFGEESDYELFLNLIGGK